MERTKTAEENDGRIWFKKVGRKPFRLGNRIIKPNESFRAFPHEISQAIRDQVIPLEALIEVGGVETVQPIVPVKVEYKLKQRLDKNGGSTTWWDVIDPKGKVLNEKGLHKEVAEKLIVDLGK